jgi:hypothetical protein
MMRVLGAERRRAQTGRRGGVPSAGACGGRCGEWCLQPVQPVLLVLSVLLVLRVLLVLLVLQAMRAIRAMRRVLAQVRPAGSPVMFGRTGPPARGAGSPAARP